MADDSTLRAAAGPADRRAAGDLFPLVYDELRRLAARKLAQERPGQTLQATALVHEAYLRLAGNPAADHWDGRGHFFAAAAEAMRRILIDRARARQTAKRGGGHEREPLAAAEALAAPDGEPAEDLLALDEALTRLEAEHPLKARLVKLRYFAGTSLEETAGLLGISPATAKRHWVYARAWLYGQLHGE